MKKPEQYGMLLFETSTLDEVNIKDMFETMANKMNEALITQVLKILPIRFQSYKIGEGEKLLQKENFNIKFNLNFSL